jgi:hypothetical protein
VEVLRSRLRSPADLRYRRDVLGGASAGDDALLFVDAPLVVENPNSGQAGRSGPAIRA